MERSVLLLYMSPFGKNPNIHTQTNEAAAFGAEKAQGRSGLHSGAVPGTGAE